MPKSRANIVDPSPIPGLANSKLEAWIEIVGELFDFSVDDLSISLTVGNKTFVFYRESKEARSVLERINSSCIGLKIGMLRTDLPEKPIVIRMIE